MSEKLSYEHIASLNPWDQIALVNSTFLREEGDAPLLSTAFFKQFKLITEEFEETNGAYNNILFLSDELRDGIGDMITVIFGSMWRANLKFDPAYWVEQWGVPGTPLNYSKEETGEKFYELKKAYEDLALAINHQSESGEEPNAPQIETITRLYNELIFKLTGFAAFLGVPVVSDLTNITFSNLSKVCKTEKELEETVLKYSNLGVSVYDRVTPAGGWAVFSAKDQYDTAGTFYPANKFLKNVYMTQPFFPSIKTFPDAVPQSVEHVHSLGIIAGLAADDENKTE